MKSSVSADLSSQVKEAAGMVRSVAGLLADVRECDRQPACSDGVDRAVDTEGRRMRF